MYKILFVLILILSHLAHGQTSKIIATVADNPITQHDLEVRMRLLQELSKTTIKQENLYRAKQDILHTLINEAVFIKEAEKLRIKVKDIAIDQAIRDVEQENSFPETYIFQILAKNKDFDKSYRAQVRSQLMWHEVVRHYIEPKVKISEQEIELAVSSSNPEYVNIDFKQIMIPGDNQNPSKIIDDLRKYKISCKNFDKILNLIPSALDYVNINETLDRASPNLLPILVTADIDELANVPGESNKAILVCSKQVTAADDMLKKITENIHYANLEIEVSNYINRIRKNYSINVR